MAITPASAAAAAAKYCAATGNPAALPNITVLCEAIMAQIVLDAEVLPTGTVPMNVAAAPGPVAGTGKLT